MTRAQEVTIILITDNLNSCVTFSDHCPATLCEQNRWVQPFWPPDLSQRQPRCSHIISGRLRSIPPCSFSFLRMEWKWHLLTSPVCQETCYLQQLFQAWKLLQQLLLGWVYRLKDYIIILTSVQLREVTRRTLTGCCWTARESLRGQVAAVKSSRYLPMPSTV